MKTSRPSTPNVLLFMLDQLSAKWLEAAMSGTCDVPHFRRLATEGVTFRNAISSNPVCCPARATLATGLTSRQHGVLENGYALDPALPTFMRLLQEAGWHTGAFGKVHFHPHFAGLFPDYKPYGFGTTYITEDPRGGEWLDWVERKHPAHYDAALATIWATAIPEFAAYGSERRDLRARILAVRERFDWRSLEVPDGDWRHYALPFPEEVSQTAWITDQAIAFLSEAPADRPFLTQVGYVQPHSPFCAPAEYFARINEPRIPTPVASTWPNDPLHPRGWDGASNQAGVDAASCASSRRCYFADLAHLDAQLGRLRACLEAEGRWADTVVVVLADHGEMLHDHGLLGKGNMHYDACIRVPLLLAGPGQACGLVREELVQLEDLFPTVLDLAGIAPPDLPRSGPYLCGDVPYLSGHSLLPLCRGETVPDWRTAAYVESYNNITSVDPREWARTLRTLQHRYTWYPNGGGEQLFDLKNDPDECRNLAAEPGLRGLRSELRERLLNAIVLQDHPHPQRNLFAIGVH